MRKRSVAIDSTDALGHERQISYSPDGQRLSETDETGAVTHYSYDSDGRLIGITDPAGNHIGLEYGSVDNGLAGLLAAMEYPTYREEYKYDPRGRRTQTVQILPATAQQPETRLLQRTGYDPNGNRIAQTDAADRSTLYQYDALNRLIKSTDAEGQVTRYGYDAQDNLTQVTDGNGHSHHFGYDRSGRIQTETRPSGATIRYAYDPLGQLSERTSPGGERRQYGYDPAGRKVSEQHYPAHSSSPSQHINYSYDPGHRLTAYSQSGDTHSAAQYRYDALGRKIEETVTYGEGPNAFSLSTHTHYDTAGRKQRFIYPDGSAIDYSYTANGQLNSASLPDGQAIQWQNYHWQQPTTIILPGAVRQLSYDGLQRPIQIKSQAIGSGSASAPAGELIMDYRYTYDAAGNITQRQTEEGLYSYTHDRIDRLTSAIPPPNLQQNPAHPQPGLLPTEHYHYDAVHNRTRSLHQPGLWQYSPDNQLQSYGLGAERRSYTYTPNGHTATESRGDPVTHTRQFIYNAAERLIEIKDNDQSIGHYQYDPQGRRIRKQTQTGVTWYLYSDEGLIAELNAQGQPTRYYGWKPEGLWGTDPLWLAERRSNKSSASDNPNPSGESNTLGDSTSGKQNGTNGVSDSTHSANITHQDGPNHSGRMGNPGDSTGSDQTKANPAWTVYLYHTDHLWTPQRLTDTQGQIQWSGRAETFGKTTATINHIHNPLRFPGQYEDEHGLHYNWNRDYNPNLGRYVQSDPIGLEGGVNIMSYSESSPIMKYDETGEASSGVGGVVVITTIICGRIIYKAYRMRKRMAQACDSIYSSYKVVCSMPSGCKKSDTCSENAIKTMNASGCISMRKLYLEMGCCSLKSQGTGVSGKIKHLARSDPDKERCVRRHEDQIAQRERGLQRCLDYRRSECSCDNCDVAQISFEYDHD